MDMKIKGGSGGQLSKGIRSVDMWREGNDY